MRKIKIRKNSSYINFNNLSKKYVQNLNCKIKHSFRYLETFRKMFYYVHKKIKKYPSGKKKYKDRFILKKSLMTNPKI